MKLSFAFLGSEGRSLVNHRHDALIPATAGGPEASDAEPETEKKIEALDTQTRRSKSVSAAALQPEEAQGRRLSDRFNT